MSKKEKLTNMLIDKYYNERYDINTTNKKKNLKEIDLHNNTLDKSINVSVFENNMNKALEKMDLVDNIDFNISMDTLKIIEMAKRIQIKRRCFKENIYFIITSILILSVFSVIFLRVGIKGIIYFQLVIVFFLPWCLIPLAKYTLGREQNE